MNPGPARPSPRSFPARRHRLLGIAILGASLPLAALAATSSATGAASAPAAAASRPDAPTVAAEIATKCKAMTGDERTACIHDVRKAAAERRAHHAPVQAGPATR